MGGDADNAWKAVSRKSAQGSAVLSPRRSLPERLTSGLWASLFVLLGVVFGDSGALAADGMAQNGWRQLVWVAAAITAIGAATLFALICILTRRLRARDRVAAALEESRRSFETALKVAQIGSWTFDLARPETIAWSPEMFGIFGVDPATWTPSLQRLVDLVHPEDQPKLHRARDEALGGGTAFGLDHRIVRPDGAIRWVHAQGEIIRDAKGRPVQIVGTVHDITDRKGVEDALRLSEARLRDYMETGSDWHWETGPDHRFTYISERVRAFGLDERARLGKTRLEIATDVEEQPEKWRDHMATLDRHEPFRDFVYRRKVADEPERYISISGKPVFDPEGRFLGYRGTSRDVTAMIQAEEALRLSEARLRDYAETASDWYWETGRDHRFTYMSSRLLMFGQDNRVRIGKSRIELAIDREEQPEKWRNHMAALDRHEPFRDFVYKMRYRDEPERVISVSGKPFFDPNGAFLGYRGTARDVTAEIRAEEALRLSEARLRDYAETASDWFWETGPDHRFTHMSSRIRFFGMDDTTWVGKTRFECAADRDERPDQWRDHVATLDRHAAFRDFVYRVKGVDGRDIYISVGGKPVFGADGRFAGYRGTARDVTATIQSEAKLREAKAAAETANAAKTAFLANMSHELRTPLNAIIGFAEALAAGYFGPLNDKQAEYLHDIKSSGDHLLLLISDLLDVSKIEAGKFELSREKLDVAEEIAACLRLVRPKADQSRIALSADVPNGLIPCYADRRALKQVLLNLLSNAIKFTPPGGRVTVEARGEPEGDLRISVSDTGIGIAPQDLPKIVVPFGSLGRNANLSRVAEGTGLGLPLSKSLVELHGGKLEIVSELGRGTIATVRFPPYPAAA